MLLIHGVPVLLILRLQKSGQDGQACAPAVQEMDISTLGKLTASGLAGAPAEGEYPSNSASKTAWTPPDVSESKEVQAPIAVDLGRKTVLSSRFPVMNSLGTMALDLVPSLGHTRKEIGNAMRDRRISRSARSGPHGQACANLALATHTSTYGKSMASEVVGATEEEE